MDSGFPFTQSTSFMNLLNSQQGNPSLEPNPYDGFSPTIDLRSSEVPVISSQIVSSDDPIPNKPRRRSRKERRNWTPKEDVLLISAWLNTSKDAVAGNEQRAVAFWKRIAAYFNSGVANTPDLAGAANRDHTHCKQRWQKINDQVCKFAGCYEAAKSVKKSGFVPDDYKKAAMELFFSDHGSKFLFEHAWLELRHDQKWCASRSEGSSKKRKTDTGSTQSSRTHPVCLEDDEPLPRPPGVKASKAKGKRSVAQQINHELEFQNMWAIKEKDLTMKAKLYDKKLLDDLLLRQEPLSDTEEALKNKLISDMLSN